MKKLRFAVASAVIAAPLLAVQGGRAASVDAGVGNIPQDTQSNAAYAASFASAGVSNVFATTQKVSCYRPEVSAAAFNDGPTDGYTGETACAGSATTGEDTGVSEYATQFGSNPGFPMSSPQLVKDRSESDIRVDPTDANHLIGSSKWFASAEGYNHLLGFYESFDGGSTWTVQGHIPGYEGWTDNTDPVGAFDGFGNFYEFNLAYQFDYNSDGSHNFNIGTPKEPNPDQPAEVVSVAVRPHGASTSQQWITTHNGHPDIVKAYDSIGNEPDKQWMTIDSNQFLADGVTPNPNYNNIYLMWVDFHFLTPLPFVSVARANPDGTHTDWSAPLALPLAPHSPQGATYLLPHVDPNGVIYTTITNFNPRKGFCCASIFVDRSTDGGTTWSVVSTAVNSITPPPLVYANTTFRDGIENTFAVGNHLDSHGSYPLYIAYEDFSAGVDNVLLTISNDGGVTWQTPIQVNDNAGAVDEFQPNLAVASDGTVSVNFYDRRLSCPVSGSAAAARAGLALDTVNPHYSGSLPPYGATNYCVNASIQFYDARLSPIGNNIRLTQDTWDPQLNSPHPDSPSGEATFIGDYFGNITDGTTDFSTFVSTVDTGSNPNHYQQQVVAALPIP
jgi:hypothetical protein